MKVCNLTACFSFFGLLATAAIAGAQLSGAASPAGTVAPTNVAPTNVQAGPVDAQTTVGATTVNPGRGPAAAVANQSQDDAAARQGNRLEPREDRQTDRNAGSNWRMRRYNNQWWYWNPNNTWSVYRNNQWVPYTVGNTTFAPGAGTNEPATRYAAPGAQGPRRQVTGYRGFAPDSGGGMNGQSNDPMIGGFR